MRHSRYLKLSVREFAEYALRCGDLVTGAADPARMLEGTRAHQAIQRASADGYRAEVPVSITAESGGVKLAISGRIDGLIETAGAVVIEEIKSTAADPKEVGENDNPVHWGQAVTYAHIYCHQNGLAGADVRLAYVNPETMEIKRYTRSYSATELEGLFAEMLASHARRAVTLADWADARDASAAALAFPFGGYRRGQREMAVAVYKTIRNGGRLFAEASTGTGKTMAALFPAAKALGEGLCDRIFYLTARTLARGIAEAAHEKLAAGGLRLKAVTLTAKEKVCRTPGAECDPDECPYARGYYDRIRGAIDEIFDRDSFRRDTIAAIAEKHAVCPFEFSLDLSLVSDLIICDYNYAFDPRVYLKRFFLEENGVHCFLVDEAHNLVDRAREMFSAEISGPKFAALRKKIGKTDRRLWKAAGGIANHLKKAAAEAETAEDRFTRADLPKELNALADAFAGRAREWLDSGAEAPFGEELLEAFFDCLAFVRTAGYYDERYVTLYTRSEKSLAAKMFCVDPAKLMNEALGRAASCVLFSATLSPAAYFMECLGSASASSMKLPSPFPPANLKVLGELKLSTRYADRSGSYDAIAGHIRSFCGVRPGNYMAFFPSYAYLSEISGRLETSHGVAELLIQRPGMTEAEREEFLARFEESPGERGLLGLAVMGGSFGEGIDLAGDRLTGAIVVGVGLPQICVEREAIRKYFDGLAGRGFDYAYAFPGMNRVLQAAGRIIRTETDRGILLLIDDRFDRRPYRDLIPLHWRPVRPVSGAGGTAEEVAGFWSGADATR